MARPILKYSHTSHLFGLISSYEIRDRAKRAGFEWDPRGFWKTASAYRALQFAEYADVGAETILRPYLAAVRESQALDSILKIPVPEGLAYMPFQKAGIAYASRRFNVLLGCQPGLGKSIMAIGTANYLGLKKLLVICPAGLRLNWAREIEKWHMFNPGIEVCLTGRSALPKGRTIITSYDLTSRLTGFQKNDFDLAIVDEGHYVKTPTAQRTKLVLGYRGAPGAIDLAPRRMVLTGTPVPNRVNEIYPIIRKLCPTAIDNMNFRAFLRYYGVMVYTQFGEQCVGIQHEQELYTRLRAGLMVRRLKSDVLHDLPKKQYKMIVFPKNGGFATILKREQQFSAQEIIKHGAPVGTALPEIRHEMGVLKAPLVGKYVEDLLEDGVQKIVIFAHHKAVIDILAQGLKDYGVLTITGMTSARQKQSNTDSFQGDSKYRVMIANLVAGGVGNTWTAAADVVLAEASWVPGENDQAVDRLHRIGQTRRVLVHIPVVEGSLDAKILGSAARKQDDISKVLDGVRNA